MKEITGGKKKKNASECIRDKDDKLLFEDQIRSRWEEYATELCNDNRNEDCILGDDEGEVMMEEEQAASGALKKN